MKLVVQIPCLNEEQTLPVVLDSIPSEIAGVDEIEVVVIDDGSADRTAEIARAHGATVLRHTRTMGLARSFRDGVDHALAVGADVVVNTDGDNQYPQERIPELIAPIVSGRADMVVGDRQTATVEHFSGVKKILQHLGSRVVNAAAGTDLPDAASGFRAYSRGALLRLNVTSRFSYCMETIIQAGHRRLRVESIPIRTNAKTRESRLFPTIGHHVVRSGATIVRAYLMFRPYLLLLTLGLLFGLLGLIPFVRFAVLVATGDGSGHVQSLIFGTAMLVACFFCVALLVITDLLRTNRILIEENLERTKTMQYAAAPKDTERPSQAVAEQVRVERLRRAG